MGDTPAPLLEMILTLTFWVSLQSAAFMCDVRVWGGDLGSLQTYVLEGCMSACLKDLDLPGHHQAQRPDGPYRIGMMWALHQRCPDRSNL